MKAIYKLPVKQGLVIKVQSGNIPIKLDNTEVRLDVDEYDHLNCVTLIISGAELRRESSGTIISSYPELEELVFRMTTYIANNILIQTGFDALCLENVLDTPDILPESCEEEEVFANNTITVRSSLIGSYTIQRDFRPEECITGFNHTAAFASCADGLRITSPFIQYEQFYKVIEHFFKEKGDKLDAAVSKHVKHVLKRNSKYGQAQIEKMRKLRNRCIHPNSYSHLGHANPENIKSVEDVRAELPLMRDLALLLLRHPPILDDN